ncbi:hypothetical protein Acr_29g0000370 [Actinidia rufa]|uniref:Retrotransposon gag domain-containing protein n=1 Tax=Actinidia rufa TaxID=165716 RepID=A0A7J0HD18_9ERIC|nr:hypothetical protein Acr_29g0000370 [Actinidia rufa]
MELVAHDLFGGCLSPNPLDRGKTSPWNLAKSSPPSSPEPPSEYSYELAQSQSAVSFLAFGRGRALGLINLHQNPPESYLYMETIHREILSSTTPTITRYSPDGNLPNRVSYISEISFHTYPSKDLAVAPQASEAPCLGDRAILTVGCSPRFLPQQFGAICGNDSSQSSMHLHSHNLPKPSASSPPGNRSHPIGNPGQVPNLEGLHRGIHDMAKQMRVMNKNNGREGGGVLTEATISGHEISPPHKRFEIWTHRLDAINTGMNVLVTVDTLIRQTEPPFTGRILRARVSSKFKLPTQLSIYEGKIDPMDHLDSYKSLMLLQGCSDEVMCKAFSITLKGTARSWFRKLSPGTIDSFGDLSRLFIANFISCRNRQKNASHLFTIHQKETESLKDFVKRFNQAILEVEDPNDKSKADKYIAAEELAEVKRRRRGKDDLKRKEPDTRRNDYREETRYKKPDRDPKCTNNRRPRHSTSQPRVYIYRHSTLLLPKYSQKLSTKNSSNGPKRSRLTPRRGTGTNIVNSTGTTDAIPRTISN